LLCRWKPLVIVLDVFGLDATADSIWQDGQDRLSECILLGESFRLEGRTNVIGIDKPAATCDSKVIGI